MVKTSQQHYDLQSHLILEKKKKKCYVNNHHNTSCTCQLINVKLGLVA